MCRRPGIGVGTLMVGKPPTNQTTIFYTADEFEYDAPIIWFGIERSIFNRYCILTLQPFLCTMLFRLSQPPSPFIQIFANGKVCHG